MIKARVGIGTVVDNIKDIGRSFKEAQMALLIGGIFDSEKSIVDYNRLGIGRLIYQLPPTLCKLFLKRCSRKAPLKLWIPRRCIRLTNFLKTILM